MINIKKFSFFLFTTIFSCNFVLGTANWNFYGEISDLMNLEKVYRNDQLNESNLRGIQSIIRSIVVKDLAQSTHTTLESGKVIEQPLAQKFRDLVKDNLLRKWASQVRNNYSKKYKYLMSELESGYYEPTDPTIIPQYEELTGKINQDIKNLKLLIKLATAECAYKQQIYLLRDKDAVENGHFSSNKVYRIVSFMQHMSNNLSNIFYNSKPEDYAINIKMATLKADSELLNHNYTNAAFIGRELLQIKTDLSTNLKDNYSRAINRVGGLNFIEKLSKENSASLNSYRTYILEKIHFYENQPGTEEEARCILIKYLKFINEMISLVQSFSDVDEIFDFIISRLALLANEVGSEITEGQQLLSKLKNALKQNNNVVHLTNNYKSEVLEELTIPFIMKHFAKQLGLKEALETQPKAQSIYKTQKIQEGVLFGREFATRHKISSTEEAERKELLQLMQNELSTISNLDFSSSTESFFEEKNLDASILDASIKAPSVGDDFVGVSIDDAYDVRSINNDDVASNDDLASQDSNGSFVQVPKLSIGDDLEDDFVNVNVEE